MSEETVPVTFTAVDNLSKAVEQMTKLLEKMNVAQEENTDETEKATKATEDQAEKTSFLSGALGKAFAAVELIKSGYEAMSGVIEFGAEQVGKMNEAWDEQSKKTGKAASSLGSIAEASAKYEKQQMKVYASLGKIIDRSSVYQAYTMAATDSLKDFEKWLKSNNQEIAEFGNQLGIAGATHLQDFGKFLKDNSETLARFTKLLVATKDGVVFLKDSVMILVDTLKITLFGALTVVSQGVLELTNGLIYLMKAAGQDIPQALEDMRIGLENTSKYGVQGMIDSAGELEKSVDSAIGSATKMVDNVALATTGTTSELKGTIDTINAVGDAAVKTGEKIEKNLRAGVKGGGRGRSDLRDEEAEAERAQARSLDYEKRILQAREAGNELYAIELEREKALYELELSLKGIKTEDLRFQTRTLENLKIEIEEKQKLKALEDERIQKAREDYESQSAFDAERRAFEDYEQEKLKERYDIAMANIKSRQDAELEAVSLVSEAMADAFANVPDMIDGISESTTRMLNGFGKAALKTGDLTKALMKMNAQNATAKDQQDAINSAIGAGAGVLSGVTAAFIEDKRKQAAIEALINAAAAAASYATGNIPAGIAYTAAAVTYGAAAAFGGGGSGASVGGSGGAGMTGAGGSMPNVENERRANAEAIAEAIQESRTSQGVTVNLSFDNALIAADSPQAARIIADLVGPELQNILRS